METGSSWYDDRTIEYFWVKPADYVTITELPGYEAKTTFDHYDAWLTQTFGPGGWWHDDDAKWIASDRTYYFKKEQDRMLFLLRFSE